jgi:CRISPR-associated protein Cas2
MYFVAAYDVDERRVGKMLKIFRKYLTWVQNSVFEGELTEAQYARLKEEASGLMDPDHDSVIFWNVRAEKYCDREVLGTERGTTGRLL